MIAVDALLLALVIYERSIWILIMAMVVTALRRVPPFANQIAAMLELDSAVGLTALTARFLLPAWDSPDRVMSRAIDLAQEKDRAAVVVPVPGSLVPPAQTAMDRDTSRDGWIVKMAEARDENGDYMFSANQIDKAIGAHRATTLARVKEIRENKPPAVYREENGGVAPATYPITKAP